MTADDFRKMVAPFIIRTASGRSYVVDDPRNIRIPEEYPHTAAISVPGREVVMLSLDAIKRIDSSPKR